MGNTCTSNKFCQNCGNTDAVEFVVGNFYLERFQEEKTPMASLDRYDKFYRAVCYPLTHLKARDIFADLNMLSKKIDKEHENMAVCGKNAYKQYMKNVAMLRHSVDLMPIQVFIDHFSQKKQWQAPLRKDTAFNQLLHMPDLFCVVNREKFEFAK